MIKSLFEEPEAQPAGEPPVQTSCINHVRVPAVFSCEACNASICATCAFTYAGDRRFCPACATAPRDVLSPERRKKANVSLALAAVATAGTAFLPILSPFFADGEALSEAALGWLMSFMGLVPALIGLIMASSVTQKGGGNPPRVKAGIVWNGIILGLFALMMVAGLFVTE